MERDGENSAMRPNKPMPPGGWIRMLIRVGLGIVFIYSGSEKIIHPQEFLATIYDFKLTGPNLGLLTAAVMPWFELLLGFALLSGVLPGGALLATWCLCLLFLGLQISAILRGLNINCGCFGYDEHHKIGKYTLFRAFALFAIAFLTWCWTWFCAGRGGVVASPPAGPGPAHSLAEKAVPEAAISRS